MFKEGWGLLKRGGFGKESPVVEFFVTVKFG